MTTPATRYLKIALLADAAFALTGGIAFFVANGPLTSLMGLTDTIFLTVLGIGLVLYGIDQVIVAVKFASNTLFTKIFFAADIVWILGSAILAIGFSELFSTAGLVLIDLAALAVAGFAYSKYVGLKKLSHSNLQHA